MDVMDEIAKLNKIETCEFFNVFWVKLNVMY